MIFFRRSATTENYKEFKKIFRQIGQISTQETVQEVDVLSGFFTGIVIERTRARRLTLAQREALLEMIEAKQEERREELEAEEDEEYFDEEDTAPRVVQFGSR